MTRTGGHGGNTLTLAGRKATSQLRTCNQATILQSGDVSGRQEQSCWCLTRGGGPSEGPSGRILQGVIIQLGMEE